MNWRERFGMIFLLGVAIVAAVMGVHLLQRALDFLTGSP